MQRLFTALAALSLLAAVVAQPAVSAQKAQVSNTVTAAWGPYEDPLTGAFKGSVTAPANRFCVEGRKVEVFHGGRKVGSAKADRYGSWAIVFSAPIQPGSYVAKVAKTKLPASLQKTPGKAGAIYCKAASSKPVTVG
jgi:hypothetical protein